MKRSAAILAATICLAACTPGDAPTPTSTAAATGSETASGTPAWARPTGTPASTTAPLIEGDGGLTWEAYNPDPTENPGWLLWATRLYDREGDRYWRLTNEDQAQYGLTPSPHHDVAIGVALGSNGLPAGQSVLVDLASGEIRALTPFPLVVESWHAYDSLDSGTLLVRVDQRQQEQGRTWLAGPYEIDLTAGEIRSVTPALADPWGVPVPDGSALPAGALGLSAADSDGKRAFVLRSPDDSTRVLVEDVEMVWWNPTWTTALLEQRFGQEHLVSFVFFDAQTGRTRPVQAPPSIGSPRWSPDGRMLALSSWDGRVAFYEPGPGSGTLQPMIGPIVGSVFGDWGPGESPAEALLLANYCEGERGFNLDRLDLSTGEVRRLPTAVGGFWVFDWSPDGDVIAASSPLLERGFALFDARTGADVTPPTLLEMVDGMQDVYWSGSGRWLFHTPIAGRDRCI